VWHLYEGGPLELLELSEDCAQLSRHRLSTIANVDGAPVFTYGARKWQAARSTDNYSLVGCTVAPGFEFADFRMLADDEDLCAKLRADWPDVAELI
jgi:predicted cupin superfamily sugar epimerase